MNQLSLNLVALSVFAITVSTLLGPLIHLSPVVPAAATAGLLGLAAIDTFGWQGQGSIVLLDWLAGFSAGHRARVVRHEAGHFLVAHLLEIPVTGYALNAWEAVRQGHPGQGGVRFSDVEFANELQRGSLSAQLLDRYCAIWMAGGVAESLVYGDVQGGADDRQKLQAVLAQLRLPIPERQQKERLAALRARTLLQEQSAAYEALVLALEQRASIAECYQAIEQHRQVSQDSET
jgi:hypothetical protein